MPWLVGIDEAGYGPNLGPFVMSLAAVHVADPRRRDLWKLLSDVACRAGEDPAGRLIVDDSKAVHQAGAGCGCLEPHVLPFQLLKTPLSPLARGVGGEGRGPRTLANLWPEAGAALRAANEPWYNADIDLPCQHPGDGVAAAAQTLRTACRGAGATFAAIRSVVVLPRQINALIAKHDSKAAVTLHALRQLLATLPEPRDDLPTAITVDKLGGRHYYHELLQECFEDVMILSRGESAERSVYHVCRREGACEVTFMPRAESESFAVALASMASKYLREVLMEQLNAYWQRQVPDLKPTAGYPGDAARFFADIAPTRERLGVDVALLWRVR